MGVSDLTKDGPAKVFMLCNEAIVRGAVEADVKVVSAYPGSPTSEILDSFSSVANHFDISMEISSNEKVALETCAGASMAGLRSMTSMKSVGLNVASDSFFSLSYTGVKGGMVIVVADDPQAHSSQTEQDGRPYAPSAYIPMLEPSDADEAYRMSRAAFGISEKHGAPVMLHTSTRVNHQSGMVKMGKVARTPFRRVRWDHPPGRFVTVADSARSFKASLLERTKRIEEDFAKSEFNVVSGEDSDIGMIASGAGYNYAFDATRILGIHPAVLKLGTTYPLPKGLIAEFISNLSTLMVVEELSPYLETQITAIAKDANPQLRIFGKASGHLSEALEYNPNIITEAFAKVLGLKLPVDYARILRRAKELKRGLPERWPTFCPGCPHRATLHALRQAMKGRKHVLATDIGCYSMSFLPPVEYGDTLLSMGACMGVAAGIQYAIEEKVIAMIGDSTFYHAGLPGLVNAVHHEDDLTLVILDNEVTAMTGQQPNPGSDITAGMKPAKRLVLENVVRGFGIEDLTIVDPYDIEVATSKMSEALSRKGPNVIISRRACALHSDRQKRRRGEEIVPNTVDETACQRPYACVREFNCPAISIDDDSRKAQIAQELCDGCGVCARLCPFDSIKKTREGERG
ncbi:MAG: indolepyruvate ferredoxin oxidoreductase subunit alpha [Methanobacteriota archaeon]|nr:MAG: indolepyruvate ferredoxin oxidoreductase subunit alpha [Euryarchaeota archaeon]